MYTCTTFVRFVGNAVLEPSGMMLTDTGITAKHIVMMYCCILLHSVSDLTLRSVQSQGLALQSVYF